MITSRFNKDEAVVQRDYMTANLRKRRALVLVSLLVASVAVFAALVFVATPFRSSPLFMPLFPPILSFLIFAPAMAGAAIYFRRRLWKVAEPDAHRPMMAQSSRTALVLLVLSLILLVLVLPVSPLAPSPNVAEGLAEKSANTQIGPSTNLRLQFNGSGPFAAIRAGVQIWSRNNLSLDFFLLTRANADQLGEDLAQVQDLSIASSTNATSFEYRKNDLDSGVYVVVIVNYNNDTAEIHYVIPASTSALLTSTLMIFSIVYIAMAAWWVVEARRIAARPEVPVALPPPLVQLPPGPERPTVQRGPMGAGTALGPVPGPSGGPPGPAAAGTRMPITCPRCGTAFDVFRGAGPTRIKCPSCGKEGTLAGLPMPPREPEPEAPPVPAPAAAEQPYMPRVERMPPGAVAATYRTPQAPARPVAGMAEEETILIVPPAPARPPPGPPVAPSSPPAAPPGIPEAPAIPEEPAIPVTPPPTRSISCPRCRRIFSIAKVEGPQQIRCPHCGKEGTIGAKKPAAPAPMPQPAAPPVVHVPAEPVTPVPLQAPRPAAAAPRMISCPACRKPFPVADSHRPLQVRCPNCGKEGMLRK